MIHTVALIKWNGVEILLNFFEAISSILRILKIRILACSQFKSKRGILKCLLNDNEYQISVNFLRKPSFVK